MASVAPPRRELYNAALDERRGAGQSARPPNIKEVRPEYRDIHSQVLQVVVTRLDTALRAFFRRVKNGETPGYPRVQGSKRDNSFTYKRFGAGATLDNGSLVLSKTGRIAVRWSRPLEGAPKTVTISREADGRYVCFSCADAPVKPLPPTGRETGVDLGIEAFATLAGGTRIAMRGHRKAERRLKHVQRTISRRKKGSNRHKKAVKMLAKAPQTVRRHWQDVHHKMALALVRANDTISHEDAQTANTRKHHPLAKRVSDAGWSAFLSVLSDKAACAGWVGVAVNPAFTSQRCSGCGVVVQKGYPSAGVPAQRAAQGSIGTTTPPGTENGSGRAVGEAWRWLLGGSGEGQGRVRGGSKDLFACCCPKGAPLLQWRGHSRSLRKRTPGRGMSGAATSAGIGGREVARVGMATSSR
jgi:putative transposase